MIPAIPVIIALLGCDPAYPQAFDYLIDRTIVPGVRVTPLNGPPETQRFVEALALSPHEIVSVSAEICGYRPDTALEVDAACFGEPALIDVVVDALPGSFALPPSDFDCDITSSYGYYGYSSHSSGGGYGGSGYVPYACRSTLPIRVLARSTKDESSSFIDLAFDRLHNGIPFEPATAEPRIEIVDGEPSAGGEVRLQFSVAHEGVRPNDTSIDTGPLETGGSGSGTYGGYYSSYGYGSDFRYGYLSADSPGSLYFRWYVDAGELLGTGRTGASATDAQRHYSENTLRIPEDASGELRVAVILATVPPVWSVLTLEVR